MDSEWLEEQISEEILSKITDLSQLLPHVSPKGRAQTDKHDLEQPSQD